MFKDKLTLQSIEALGFTKTPLGDSHMVDALNELYQQHQEDLTADMTVSHNHDNGHSPTLVHQAIVDIVEPYFKEVFEDFKFLASHFVVKKAHSSSYFQLHQDWNVVDESKYYNYQVWIPLDITYPENGGLCFLPESHKGFNNYRSGSNGLPLIDLDEQLHAHLSYLRLLPEEAGVFYSKTFHGSFINSSPKNRVAILVNIIQEKAESVYCHRDEEGLIHEYPISTDEIFTHLPQLEKGFWPFPDRQAIRSLEAPKIDLRLADLLSFAKERNAEKNRPEFYEHKLFHILKDKELEKEFNRKGFVLIDFLNEKTIGSLQEKMDSMFPDREQYSGTFSSVSAFDKRKRKEAHEFITQTIKSSLDNYFQDYEVPLSLYYSRRPDKQYLLDWHHDPSLIFNEHLEPLYGLWCPLIDVDMTHGALRVIPGSHRWLNKLHLAYKLVDWPFEGVRGYLEKFAREFSLHAGQAILFDARLIHGSQPNQSEVYRDNIVMRINHKRSRYFNIVNDPAHPELGKYYDQEKEFFFTDTLRNHLGQPETGRLIGELYINEDTVTKDFVDNKKDLFKDAFE